MLNDARPGCVGRSEGEQSKSKVCNGAAVCFRCLANYLTLTISPQNKNETNLDTLWLQSTTVLHDPTLTIVTMIDHSRLSAKQRLDLVFTVHAAISVITGM